MRCWPLLLSAAFAAPVAAAATARADPAATVRALVEAAVSGGQTPGLQYVAVGPEATRFEGAAGHADLAGGRLLDDTTTMMAYSMTKAITAAAVLQLVERGTLRLDAPLRELLPEIPYGDAVTLRHLLDQTSGIPNPIPLRWVHLPEEHAAHDERAVLQRRLAENPDLRFPPGERYAYSNISYWLLGRAVEQASGQPFETYVRTRIFEPLGIPAAEAGFTIPAPGRHAKGYLRRWSLMSLLRPFLVDRKFVGGEEGPWLHVRDNYLDGAAFGGVVATARAMGRFAQDALAPRSVLLGPEGRRLFLERQRDGAGRPVDMTLGWHVDPERGFLFKEGGGAGFHGEVRLYPAAGLASVAIANCGGFDVKRFLDAADAALIR